MIKYIFVENKHKYIHITIITMDDEIIDKIKVIEAELNKTKDEYKNLQDELNETKEHLKKYTAPKRSKTYYEETVFRTRDANSAVNMRKLTRSWMETQTRPSEFSYKQGLSPVIEKTGKSKTIVVKTT